MSGSLDGRMKQRKNGIKTKHKPCDCSRRVLCPMAGLLEEFERHLIIGGKSPTTIKKYLKDLRQFLRKKSDFQVSDIQRETINDWVFTLRTKNCSTGTIANHLWAIK